MSRRKRRADERRLAQKGERSRITIWTIIIIALIVIVIGLARSFK